uniref:Zn(2)-C6 fungal-type domain-containing protein n=1 Tax=Peronospora matthiolae TaxID=2874970 RepID=A0AAV1TNB8_9STRA
MTSAANHDATVAAGEDLHPLKRAKTVSAATATRTCQFCTSKKQVAACCANVACKRCCLTRAQVCGMHPKEEEKSEPEPSKLKKPVLKNEFREPNFHYYGETVTIYCVRDFFQNKKLSQGVLKDQERTQRASGNADGVRRKKKSARASRIQELVQCALGKKPLPKGSQEVDGPVRVAVND